MYRVSHDTVVNQRGEVTVRVKMFRENITEYLTNNCTFKEDKLLSLVMDHIYIYIFFIYSYIMKK